MVMEELELKKSVLAGVRKTVNKCREQPYIFFTEMDIYSYLYRYLYSKRSEVKTQDGVVMRARFLAENVIRAVNASEIFKTFVTN